MQEKIVPETLSKAPLPHHVDINFFIIIPGYQSPRDACFVLYHVRPDLKNVNQERSRDFKRPSPINQKYTYAHIRDL